MIDKQRLCSFSEIANQCAKGFTVELDGKEIDIFLVRAGAEVFGYVNSCPHTGVNLNWMPDEFMDITGKLIQCSTHGALFLIEDGYCCYGPCAGASLQPVRLLINEGEIFLSPETPTDQE